MTIKSSLEGKTIVTTQPLDHAAEMLSLLKSSGARAIHLPLTKTRINDISIEKKEVFDNLHSFNLIVFTSKRGVQGFFQNLIKTNPEYQWPENLRIAAVGQTTASEIERFNHKVDFLNPGTDSIALASYLIEKAIRKDTRVLLALGNRAPEYLELQFGNIAYVERINVYETIRIEYVDPDKVALVRSGNVDMFIFTSPSGFDAFLDNFGEKLTCNLAAIGNSTAKAITDKGFTVCAIPETPSAHSMIEALERFFEVDINH